MIHAGYVNVVVVGGGAAGLAAAVAAEEAGLSCQLIEAQGRLGGRVQTAPLQSGGVFDAGAQMLNGDMANVLELAAEAGAHLSPMPQTGATLCVVQNEVLNAEDLISDEELFELLEDQVVRWDSMGEALRAIRLKLNWLTTPWESVGEANRGLRLLVENKPAPKGSLAEAIRALLLAQEEEALAMSLFTELLGAGPDHVAALAVRDAFMSYPSERSDAEFQPATGLMPVIDQMAMKLKHAPELDAPVQRITQRTGGVEVAAERFFWTADHVIVAAPPPVARRIDFDIAGAKALSVLLSSFEAGDMIKSALVFDEPFWRMRGLNGAVTFADPAGLAVMDAGLDTGQKPRLVAFQGGPLAREWAALPQAERQAHLLRHLRRAFGAKMPDPCEIAEAIWVDHPWSGGGYNASVRTGGDPDAVNRLAAWAGPVRFAGAEISDRFWGYVEGAIHSGQTAIARIMSETSDGN